MSMPSQAVMAISMYSEMFARSRGQDLLFVNLVRRVRCDPPQDTVQSDQQSMGSGAAIFPPGFAAKTMHRLPAPLPQTGYDAPACKTNVQDDDQTPEPHTGLQGEGGSSRRPRRQDAGRVSTAVRHSSQPDHPVEGAASRRGGWGVRLGGAGRACRADLTVLHAKIGELTLENDFLAGKGGFGRAQSD